MKKLLLLLSCLLILGCETQAIHRLPPAPTELIKPYVDRLSEHEEAIELLHDRQNKLEFRLKELETKYGHILEENLIELDECQGK